MIKHSQSSEHDWVVLVGVCRVCGQKKPDCCVAELYPVFSVNIIRDSYLRKRFCIFRIVCIILTCIILTSIRNKKNIGILYVGLSSKVETRLSVTTFRCSRSYKWLSLATYENLWPGKAGKSNLTSAAQTEPKDPFSLCLQPGVGRVGLQGKASRLVCFGI